MVQLVYEVTPSAQAALRLDARTFDKMIALRLRVADGDLLPIFIDLDEIKTLVSKKHWSGLRNMQGMTRIMSLLIRYLARLLVIDLHLEDVELRLKVSTGVNVRLHQHAKVVWSFYVAPSERLYLENILTRFHHGFMRNHSVLFNNTMKFPVIIGRCLIRGIDLLQLKPGNVLVFDSIDFPVHAKCLLGNFQMDVAD